MSQTGPPRGRVTALSLTIALAGFSTTVNAQEVRALSEEIHQFNSPMVLEMSLDLLLDKPVGEKWSTDKTKFFTCRGVTIESLEFRVQPESESSVKTVDIRALLNNNSGKDKRTFVRFEGVDGEKVVGVTIVQVNLNQGDTSKAHTMLVLRSPERWAQLPRPKLRVTVTLQDY